MRDPLGHLQTHVRTRMQSDARARLLSTSCREASAWIDALPSMQQLTLSSEVFSLSVLMRLGLALPVTRGMSTCPNPKCSASVDPEGLHLLSCSKGPGRVRLHDGMVRAWHSMILSAGLRATVEQRGLYPDCRRPDIVVPDYCDYHQDLHRRRLRPGSRLGMHGHHRALLLVGAGLSPRRPGMGTAPLAPSIFRAS